MRHFEYLSTVSHCVLLCYLCYHLFRQKRHEPRAPALRLLLTEKHMVSLAIQEFLSNITKDEAKKNPDMCMSTHHPQLSLMAYSDGTSA